MKKYQDTQKKRLLEFDLKRQSNFLAHADYSELIQWFAQSNISPKTVFLTHGEPAAADNFRLADRFGWNCVVPEAGQKVTLS